MNVFRKIHSIVSPMTAMRIDPNSASLQLEPKLHLVTQFLISSTKQFDSWMELQSANNMHANLFEIFKRSYKGYQDNKLKITQQQLICVFQFYTLLLINCKDQLLICKLVSDDFVIQMCRLEKVIQSLACELQAYRINLIKSYMGKITPEIVKYMVIQDKFKVFQVCVSLFNSTIGTGTVQYTTISNIILNIMKKVDEIDFLWDNVWTIQGLQILYTCSFQFIIKQLRGEQLNTKQALYEEKEQKIQLQNQQNAYQDQEKNHDSQINQALVNQETKQQIINQVSKQSNIENSKENIEQKYNKDTNDKILTSTITKEEIFNMEQVVLFLVELSNSVQNQQKKKTISQYCYLNLQQVMDSFWKYESFEVRISCFSIFFALFKSYNFEVQLIQNSLSQFTSQIIAYFQIVKQGSDCQLLCRSMFVLSKMILSKHSYITERVLYGQVLSKQKIIQIKQLRQRLMSLFIKLISMSIQIFQNSNVRLLLLFLKHLLLTCFYLKIALKQKVVLDKQFQNTPQIQLLCQKLNEAILQLFLIYTEDIKKLMMQTQMWANIIKWYEEASNRVTLNLLCSPDVFQHFSQDSSYLTLLLNQYIKNYRYMIVEHTTLSPKALKQQKFYHTTFTSQGVSYEPGSIINQKVKIIATCLFLHNYQQIPVVIIEDIECFIIGMKLPAQQIKILVNIRFKDIDNFSFSGNQNLETVGQLPKFARINLKGMQQILLEFSNPKVTGNLFREYLIKSRDMTRQRQLSFLNKWLKDYQLDAEKSLDIVKQKLKKEDCIMP